MDKNDEINNNLNGLLGVGTYVETKTVSLDENRKAVQAVADIPEWLVDVVRQRRQGVSMTIISEELGVPFATVQKAYHRVMNDFQSDAPEAIIAAREEQIARLDDQLKKMLELQEADSENLKIVDKILAIEARRAKLLGLDAPERVDARVIATSFEDQLKALDADYVEINE